ncbi:MAG: major capsid protein, partial [Succinivibrio dextrinosolvens]|nr:major capsid protein [Succinivibrio dextrinosolvens]
RYMADNGNATKYIPDDTFILLPPGNLGNTWFGTTPEESDLMASSTVENVSIVDTGVAITTTKQTDPVNVEIKVTQICLPDFPTADQIVIADVTPA